MTVLLTTTRCAPRRPSDSAAPIWPIASRSSAFEKPPVSSLGVGTMMKVTSVSAIASRMFVVARSADPPCARTSSASPGSTIGDRPALISATLRAMTSTPIVRNPAALRHAASGSPSFPSPTTETAEGGTVPEGPVMRRGLGA